MSKKYLGDDSQDAILTVKGEDFLQNPGIDSSVLKLQKRCYCRMCMDWSEREHHIAGSVGKALKDYFVDNGLVGLHRFGG